MNGRTSAGQVHYLVRERLLFDLAEEPHPRERTTKSLCETLGPDGDRSGDDPSREFEPVPATSNGGCGREDEVLTVTSGDRDLAVLGSTDDVLRGAQELGECRGLSYGPGTHHTSVQNYFRYVNVGLARLTALR